MGGREGGRDGRWGMRAGRVQRVGRGNEGTRGGNEGTRGGNKRSGCTLMNTLVLPICQSWSPSTLLQMHREVILKSVTSVIVSPGISTR